MQCKYFLEAKIENLINGSLSPLKKPVLHIESGDTVEIETISKLGIIGSFHEYLQSHGLKYDNPIYDKIIAAEALPEIFPNGHVVTGPIYIKDAMPGDILEVEILTTTLTTDFANAMTLPGFGGLPEQTTKSISYQAIFNEEKTKADFCDLKIDLAPFFGILGNAPADELPSGPPYYVGGNLDCKEFVAGSKVYLPIAVQGALFYVGDGHAAQGDGEVSLDALETSLSGKFKFTLHKNKKNKLPYGETPTDYVIMGLNQDLNLAMRQALEEAVNFIMEKKSCNFYQALTMASIIADFRVTQIVDETLGIHCLIKKKYFS